MKLKEKLLRGIYAYGFERPSAIQQRAILPCILGHDVIAQAQSGTGKTATFAISLLQQIDIELNECQALVLAPTRELAQQIQKVVLALGDYMDAQCHACIGGTNVREDLRKLQMGVHVVVGTPGRVFDMINRRALSKFLSLILGLIDLWTVVMALALETNSIRVFVLDEADEMLSRGFKDQIYDVFRNLPTEVQVWRCLISIFPFQSNLIFSCFSFKVILLSATMPSDVMEVTQHFMRSPIRILVKKEELTLEGIKQFYVQVSYFFGLGLVLALHP